MQNHLSSVSKNHYFEALNNLIGAKKNVKELISGSRRTIYIDNEPNLSYCPESTIDIGGLTKYKFHGFLSAFHRVLYSQMRKNEDLWFINKFYDGASRKRNYDVWDQMEITEYYYNIDLNSAYWQILYRLGYINQSFFLKYKDLDDYKYAKRYCVSFLSRESFMAKADNMDEVEIECNTEIFNQIYTNVRNELYLCIQNALNGVKNWVEFNIDSIVVRESDKLKVCRAFKKMGLEYKIKKYKKISDTEYLYQGKFKKFKRISIK